MTKIAALTAMAIASTGAHAALSSNATLSIGGDAVTGSATVISAMGAGKRAAADIDKFLTGG